MDGMVSSHGDDFILAGTERFMNEITQKIEEKLEISKLEDNEFIFIGMDMKRENYRIVVSMEEYAKSLKKIMVGQGLPGEKLMDVEMKVNRKYVVKLTWLANKTRPD